MLKKENGVTLVALVITIIVLLILAGVTLAMVLGDNGIFGRANKASLATNLSNAKDAVRMAVLEVQTENYNDNGAMKQQFTTTNISTLVDLINAKLTGAGDKYQLAAPSSNSSVVNYNGSPVKDVNDASLTASLFDASGNLVVTFTNDASEK